MALALNQPVTEMSTRDISWGYRRPVRRANNLTTFMCRLSWNLWSWTSWKPQGLTWPVMGLLYLYTVLRVRWDQTIFSTSQQPPVGQGLLTVEASRSHSDTPHSVGLLWNSERPVADTSIWNTHKSHIHAAGGIRTRNPNKRTAAGSRLRPRGHRNWRPDFTVHGNCVLRYVSVCTVQHTTNSSASESALKHS